jgi:hypothetical protein
MRVSVFKPSRRSTNHMALTTSKELREARETLAEISDLAAEALDAELTREEVVAKVKEIQDLLRATRATRGKTSGAAQLWRTLAQAL